MKRDKFGRVRFIRDGHRFYVTKRGTPRVYAITATGSERVVSVQKRTAMVRKHRELVHEAILTD